MKDEVVTIAVARVGVEANAGAGMAPAFQELTWTSAVIMRLLGNVWSVTMAFVGSAAAVLVWLRVPLLIDHDPRRRTRRSWGCSS